MADPSMLATYLATRDAERIDAADDKWAALTDREQKLVREACVMGFFLGQLGGQVERGEYPKDSTVVTRVLTAVSAYEDLYPTLAALRQEAST